MTKVKMEVNPGVCSLKTTIEAESEDMMNIVFMISSDCPHVMDLAAALKEKEITVFDAIARPIIENKLFIECSKHLEHAACPIPVALVKVCEPVGGLALKRTVEFRFV